MNIEISADNQSECSMPIIKKKLKVAGGADYDTGSNAGGYRSQAGSIRAKSLQAYKNKVRRRRSFPSRAMCDLCSDPAL